MIDDEHPYMKELLAPGKDFAIGGEFELLGKISYNDGLDQYRLTVDEARAPAAELRVVVEAQRDLLARVVHDELVCAARGCRGGGSSHTHNCARDAHRTRKARARATEPSGASPPLDYPNFPPP